MMKKRHPICRLIHWNFLFIFLFFHVHTLKAQSIESLLDAYVDDNAEHYLQPLGDLLTDNFNIGVYDWAKVDTSFHIKLAFHVMYTIPSSEMKIFKAKTGLGFEPEQEAEVPTIIGKNEAVAVPGVNGTYFIFPVGYNVKNLPLAMPQLSIGGIYHTEFNARYFAFDPDDDLGKISTIGFGIRHGLNHYFKKLPIDLSLAYHFQQLEAGKYIQQNNHLISVYAGKAGKFWSTHLGLSYQRSTTDYSYSISDENISKNYSVNTKNKYPFNAELNASLKLWILYCHAAVSYSGPISASIGIGIKI